MKEKKNKMDEHQRKGTTKAFAIIWVIAFFCLAIVVLYKLILTKSFKNSYIEIGLLTMMSIILFVYLQANKEFDLPKSIVSKKVLPLGTSKEDKLNRFIYYVQDSLRLAILFTSISIFTNNIIVPIPLFGSKALSYIANLILEFIVFLILNYLWYEFNVKGYMKNSKSEPRP